MEAATAPPIFMILVTVPLYGPPTSMGPAHAGPITMSRKKNAADKQRIEVQACDVMAAGIKKTPAANIAGAATILRANFTFPVLRCARSVRNPPAISPAIPADSGSDSDR